MINPFVKHLLVADIDTSATNPRTRFDQGSLEELAESIKQVGLIQAVTVRPKGTRYELVAGERRFRATKIAGIETIEAKIRELTDDQVLEIQLIENLDRKDVHPLEEAAHFQAMLNTGHYTTEEIASRIAKPPTFVAQRLKLNDLVPEIKEDFFNAELNLGQAIMIARMTAESQQGLYAGYKGHNRQGYGSTKELEKEIATEMLALEEAIFSRENEYRHIPACQACPKRTGNNPVLFPELQTDSCTDKLCYRQKSDYHIADEIYDIAKRQAEIALATKFSTKISPEIVAAAAEYNFPILVEYTDFKPERTDRYSENFAIYWVSGDRKGTVSTGWRVPAAEAEQAAAVPAAQYEGMSPADKLREAEKKAESLDAQKVHLTLIDSLKSEFDKREPQPISFPSGFVRGMLIYLALLGNEFYYLVPRLIELGLDIKQEYKTLEELELDLGFLSDDQVHQICALLLFRQCSKTTMPGGIHAQIIRKLAVSHANIDVDTIQAGQDAIAAARKAELEDKIKKMEGGKRKKAK